MICADTVTWPLRGRYMAVTWPLHGRYEIYADADSNAMPRSLRTVRVRTGCAQCPSLLRAVAQGSLPLGPTHCTYAVHVPASGVPYVACAVAPQVPNLASREDFLRTATASMNSLGLHDLPWHLRR